MSKVAVIAGAGPGGLTAALELLRSTDYRPIIFEPDIQVGGISKTVCYRGNRIDIGGHRFFSKSDWVMNWWQEILPVATNEPVTGPGLSLGYQGKRRNFVPSTSPASANGQVMLIRRRLSRIYYRRRFFDYPLRLSSGLLKNLGLTEAMFLSLSYGRSKISPRVPERSLEDFFVNRFGDRLYRTFFKDYTEKVWGVSCEEISAEWGAQRVKGLSIRGALVHSLKSALRSRTDIEQRDVETSLIERFLYPRLGPGQMWEAVTDKILAAGGELFTQHAVVGLDHRDGIIRRVRVRDLQTTEERWIRCDAVISTMPVSELVRQLAPADPELDRIAQGLPYRDFMTAGIVAKQMHPTSASFGSSRWIPDDNWIYIQEPDVRLGRLQIFNNWSPDMVADPRTVSLGLEYFCSKGDSLWSMSDGNFLEMASGELEKIGLVDRRDVLDGTVVRVPRAYPAYFGEYRHMDQIRSYLDHFENLFPVGRNGMHRYNNQDHSMLTAKAAVDCLTTASRDRSPMWAINTEDSYHEDSTNRRSA
jgi:protoporphyrinogen oxidase